MTVIGLTGYAQSGKDTAASFLVERGFKRLAFADILRQSVYNLNPIVVSDYGDGMAEGDRHLRVQKLVDLIGWDRAKVEYPEIRNLLQRMGTEVGRDLYGESFWVDRVLAQMERKGKEEQTAAGHWTVGYPHVVGDYVITDVRFPNEAKAVRGVSGLLYRVVRPGTGAVNNHVSDTGIAGLRVDGEIENDGSLERLRQRVLWVVGL